jgi:hypothetical protein
MNSFKKIAMVTAAAVSMGILGAVPSQATHNADTLTIDAGIDTVLTGESATAVATLSFLGQNTGDTITVTSSLVSLPAGAAQLAELSVVETTSAQVAVAGDKYSAKVSPATNSVSYVTAKIGLTLVTPSVAGTYVIKIIPSVTGGNGILNSTPVLWTVVVNAPDLKPVPATSTVILNKGETVSATADQAVYAPKATSSDAAAVIAVTQKNAAGGAASESLTAIITGSGLLGTGTNPATISAQGRALTVAAGSHIGVFADNTAGVGTVTIQTAAGVVLSTKTVTFYGDVALVVATTVKSVIATGSNASVVKAVAYDAAGVKVGAGTLNAYSNNTAVVSDSGTAATIVDGEALFTLTGVAAGGAGITVKSGTVASIAVPVRVESPVAAVKIAFDKAKYVPGEAATITVTPVDAAGLPLSAKTYANLFATGGITSSYAFGGSSDVLTGVSVTTDTSTVKTFKVFMPLTQNTVTITATGGSSLPAAGQVVVTASAVVEDATLKGATDAANDAKIAADDATTAALAATKAAEDATKAAQSAVDAVAALSTQVGTLIASLKKQITSLTALVVKIQKKVKA